MSRTYFTDRDLGNSFPDILSAAGLRVERHQDHFRPDSPEYKPNELAAVMKHGVGLLVIIGKAPFPDLARSFVANAAAVERFVAMQEPPFIAKVYRSGEIKLSYPR